MVEEGVELELDGEIVLLLLVPFCWGCWGSCLMFKAESLLLELFLLKSSLRSCSALTAIWKMSWLAEVDAVAVGVLDEEL